MPEYGDVAMFVVMLLAALGAVNLVGSTIDTLRGWRKPARDLAATVEAHGRMLASDKRRLDSMERASSLNLKAQMQLLQHAIHGNHTDAMQETLDEIQVYLVSR